MTTSLDRSLLRLSDSILDPRTTLTPRPDVTGGRHSSGDPEPRQHPAQEHDISDEESDQPKPLTHHSLHSVPIHLHRLERFERLELLKISLQYILLEHAVRVEK